MIPSRLTTFSIAWPASGLCCWLSLGCGIAAFGGGLLLALNFPVRGADKSWHDAEFYVQTWDTDDGLAYDWISHIVQDSRGFLWLATSGGLSRYDGHRFKEIKLPREFRSNGYNIRGLAEEDAHTLLLLPTSSDVVRLRDGQFSLHPASGALAGKQPADLFVEPGGALWLGMADGTLMRWDRGSARWFGPADGIGSRVGRFTFASGAGGETWVATGSFLASYQDGQLRRFQTGSAEDMMIASAGNGRLWICTPTELRELVDGRMQTLSRDVPWKDGFLTLQHYFEDESGLLWFAVGRHGLYRWDGTAFRSIEAPTPAKFVTKDREGSLWVATAGSGLARLRQKTYRVFDTHSGLVENASNGLYASPAGEIWLANNTGGILRLQDDQVQPLHLAPPGQSPSFNTVCTDQAGNLWAGGQDGLFLIPLPAKTGPQKLPVPSQNVHLLFCSRRGDLWFAADTPGQLGYYRDGVPHLFTVAQGYAGQLIRAVAEDNEGHVWLGALNGDLLCFRDDRLALYSGESGLPQQPVQDLLADNAGDLWVATAGGLLLRQGNRFHLFTQADGLADELIGRILEDDHGLLWFFSRSGIYFIEKKELLALGRGEAGHPVSYRFGRNQGLTGITPLVNYQPSAAKTRDGHLWFATARGVVTLDPTGLDLSSPPPPVVIDEVSVDNVPMLASPGIEFPSGRHRIEFRFSAPSFAFGEVQLNHQLEGADPGWVETGDTYLASYSGLAPGIYRLQVRARNGMGEWSPAPASLGFTVRPAWWQSPWLAFGILVEVSIGTAWGVRTWSQRKLKRRLRRLEQEHALEKERSRIARNLHDELGGSLTEIGLLADRLHYIPASELKPALSRLTVHTRQLHVELSSIIWTVSPKNNSLDRLAGFLQKYAGRFFRHSDVACVVEGTEAIPARPLGPDVQHHLLAIVKEALNNVLSHSRASHVVITTDFNDDNFRMVIEDDGVGFAVEGVGEDQGNGLNNMRTRAREISGTLHLESGPGLGTRLTLIYPCGAIPLDSTSPFFPANAP